MFYVSWFLMIRLMRCLRSLSLLLSAPQLLNSPPRSPAGLWLGLSTVSCCAQRSFLWNQLCLKTNLLDCWDWTRAVKLQTKVIEVSLNVGRLFIEAAGTEKRDKRTNPKVSASSTETQWTWGSRGKWPADIQLHDNITTCTNTQTRAEVFNCASYAHRAV